MEHFKCKDCGNVQIFVESGTYRRTVICDPTTGEFMDYENSEHAPSKVRCGVCDSVNIDVSES